MQTAGNFFHYWNEEEHAQGCMYGDRINETEKLRRATAKGFAEQLPEPHIAEPK
ncbi:hypothetical protein [Xenorhabdus lircayensis]|uniref:hypothetical protein n=1 Tax=Xenorhabdus lircayensis TaxID=2763499 RepID=UPI001E378B7C|nr:hypothetical protein [Xenorhabdus lircayensis]